MNNRYNNYERDRFQNSDERRSRQSFGERDLDNRYLADRDTIGQSYDDGRIQFDRRHQQNENLSSEPSYRSQYDDDFKNDFSSSSQSDRYQDHSQDRYQSRPQRDYGAQGYRSDNYTSQTFSSDLGSDFDRQRYGRRSASSSYGSQREPQRLDAWTSDSEYHQNTRPYDQNYRRSSRAMSSSHHDENLWERMKDKVKDFVGKGPKGYKRSDDRIREDVCDVLERHPRIDASNIEVEVKEGTVYLRGHVDSRYVKRMAEDAVLDCYGVSDVRNELQVSSASGLATEDLSISKTAGTTTNATSSTSSKAKGLQ